MPAVPTILIIGASRGLGLAMADEFLKKEWNVLGTVRGAARTKLHDLADAHPGRVAIEQLEITDPGQIAALRERLSARRFEILFVNAGTANRNPNEAIGQVSTEDFVRVMLTNALGLMRVVEALEHTVPQTGIVGVMSSGQGSVANNTGGQRELYRGSKAALNTFMRSFAARHTDSRCAMVLMAPGWVNTDLGGPTAPLTIADSVPSLVAVLLAQRGTPGLQYLDYRGHTVPW